MKIVALLSVLCVLAGVNLEQTAYGRVYAQHECEAATRGDVWTVQIAKTVILEDFESYDSTHPVEAVWIPNDQTVAMVWEAQAYEDSQSLSLAYYNPAGTAVAQVSRTFSELQDWSNLSVDGLVLYLRGQWDNTIEPLSFIVEDAFGGRSVQRYGRPDDLKNPSWQPWPISLNALQADGVDVSAVRMLALRIGSPEAPRLLDSTGIVWLDNIHLSSFSCEPHRVLPADLSGNCRVGIEDMAILASNWLMESELINPDRLRVWYRLNEGEGVTVLDTSGNELHAGFNTGAKPIWILDDSAEPWYADNGCIEFDGSYRIYKYGDLLGDDAVPGEFTFSLWVKGDAVSLTQAGGGLLSLMGHEGTGTVLRVRCPTPEGTVRAVTPGGNVEWMDAKAADWSEEWNHYAFVKNAAAGNVGIYHNGVSKAQNTNNFSPIVPPIRQMLIGNDNWTLPYYGRVDDVRLYNHALTSDEIRLLSGTDQQFSGLRSQGDMNGDMKVDLADIALLASQWNDHALTYTQGTAYYVNNNIGDDEHPGTHPNAPWKTLDKVNTIVFQPGDRILFRAGTSYAGSLRPQGSGTDGRPIVIDMYGEGDKPVIDGAGYVAAVHLHDVAYWEINNLEVTNDGGPAIEPQAETRRYGVLITAMDTGVQRHIYLRNMYIHHIFPTMPGGGWGRDGVGISGDPLGQTVRTVLENVLIENCHITMTASTGIFFHYRVWWRHGNPIFGYNSDIRIRNNLLENIGGPGIQPNHCKQVLVEHNIIKGSGAKADPRQKGRGSGMWPWYCQDVLVQNNAFMHARGIADSCGIHVDIGNINTVIQYNLSYDNAGGFAEILGDSYNTIYRYNISINDGWRIKGVNGALQNGHMLWLGGWTGENTPKRGPFNSHIYNNTIYLAPGLETRILLDDTAVDAFFINNIYYVDGVVYDGKPDTTAVNMNMNNNLYTKAFPSTLPEDSDAIIADPMLIAPGGLTAEDYKLLPNSPAIDAGRVIENNGGRDFWGNPLLTPPNIGANERK